MMLGIDFVEGRGDWIHMGHDYWVLEFQSELLWRKASMIFVDQRSVLTLAGRHLLILCHLN